MIPEAAYDAAFNVAIRLDMSASDAYLILEGVAPHLMAAAWLEGRNSQPDKFAANPYWSADGRIGA